MKVCIECATTELLDFVELLAYDRGYRHAVGAPKNTSTSRRDVGDLQTGDDVPNRFREEGVQ
jgi:hypothetical protein